MAVKSVHLYVCVCIVNAGQHMPSHAF